MSSPAKVDVVVIGAGYTGLSCALGLARAGRSVAAIDAQAPGFGASSRSGGMIVETRSKHVYFRPSPDGERIIFGGRVSVHPIPPARSAQLLRRELGAILPDLADVRLTHSWTGNVAFTLRELPGIGCRDGLWHALGCNGSGLALIPYLGHKLAQ